MSSSDELVIWLPDGQVDPPVNPYGRLVANAGVYRALARYGGHRHLHVQSRVPGDPVDLAGQLGLSGPASTLTTGPLLGTAAATRAGTLLSGQPYLTEPAWVRRHAGQDTGYSIVGTIFAFASAAHRERMMQSVLAPLHPWDALVCSSPSLRTTVERTFDAWQDHLTARFDLRTERLRLPRPQLPVIGFGTDVDALRARGADLAVRASQRAALGMAEDTVAVFYLGRLSYYDKAFPQAMFSAVQSAATRTAADVHLVMAGWFPNGVTDRARFEEAARQLAPQVPVTILDGNDAGLVARCWSAADVFLQLSDTILETFGQALVEAMAVGIPLVVSDWDGYRYIVRDGADGFLVPTLGAGGSRVGEALALSEQLGLVTYSQYAGSVAQHTAVNVPAAADALVALIESPALRRRMGEAGQRRAREVFAWSVVAAQYTDLFAELASLRRDAADPGPRRGATHRLNPLRADPFADFRALPTRLLTDDLVLQVAEAGRSAGDPVGAPVELDGLYPGLRAGPQEARAVLDLLATGGPATVGQVLRAFPASRRPFVRMTLLWLAKSGVVDWSPTR